MQLQGRHNFTNFTDLVPDLIGYHWKLCHLMTALGSGSDSDEYKSGRVLYQIVYTIDINHHIYRHN